MKFIISFTVLVIYTIYIMIIGTPQEKDIPLWQFIIFLILFFNMILMAVTTKEQEEK